MHSFGITCRVIFTIYIYIYICVFFFQEFLVHRKNRGNVLGKMTDSLQNIASTYTMKQLHPEFEQVRDYCTALSEKLSAIDKINHRIYKERQGTLRRLLVNRVELIASNNNVS